MGVDRFEDRSESDGPGLTLKEAHQLLRSDGVRVQLVPGNPSDAWMRIANSLGKIDLLIVPAEFDAAPQARAWFFVPRMLHENSVVYVERLQDNGQTLLEIKPRARDRQPGVRRRPSPRGLRRWVTVPHAADSTTCRRQNTSVPVPGRRRNTHFLTFPR